MLKCPEFEARLEAAVERRTALDLSAPEWVGWAEHVRRCAECSKHWREAVTLQSALAAWTTRLPDADLVDGHFADAVMARWAAESASRSVMPMATAVASPAVRTASFRWPRLAIAGLVLAAVVALGFLLPRSPGPHLANDGSTGPENPTSPSQSPDLRRDTLAPAPTVVAKNNPSDDRSSEDARNPADDDVMLTGLLRNAGTASLSLAGDAADVVREAASLVSVTRPASPSAAETTTDFPLTELPTQGLIPWSQKLESAVDFLWDALPLEDAPPT